jgi:hypothetical protein
MLAGYAVGEEKGESRELLFDKAWNGAEEGERK